MKSLYVLAFLLIAGGLLYHFAALQMFNLLVSKDADSVLVATDLAYGADQRQRLDIYKPASGVGPWPVVVFVHGGSWQSGNKGPYEFVGRALAAQGFFTLVISYRLHPANPYPAFVEDTALAIDWATRESSKYGGDSTKVFAMGHSAGAYNIALAVLDKRYLARLHTDLTHLKGVVTMAGPFDFLPLDSTITIEVFSKLADLPSTQPVAFARPDAPPFLILHGADDTTVKPRNALALTKALQQQGADAHSIIYKGVSHVEIMLALSKPLRNRAPALADAVQFMKDRSQ